MHGLRWFFSPTNNLCESIHVTSCFISVRKDILKESHNFKIYYFLVFIFKMTIIENVLFHHFWVKLRRSLSLSSCCCAPLQASQLRRHLFSLEALALKVNTGPPGFLFPLSLFAVRTHSSALSWGAGWCPRPLAVALKSFPYSAAADLSRNSHVSCSSLSAY